MSESSTIEHIACLRCGYDLYNLPPEGACPECGTPISRTIDGNLLRYSSPAYLQRLSGGILFIVLSYILSIGTMVLMVPYGFAMGFQAAAGPTEPPGWAIALAVIGSLAGLGVGVLSLLGWWRFSEPDPDFIGNDTAHGYRHGLRTIVALYAVIMVVSIPFDLMSLFTDSLMLETGSLGFGLISGLLGVVLFFVSLLYVGVIAQRIPNRFMVLRSRMYLWALPVIYIVGLLCVGLGPIIATIMYLMLLWWLRKEIMTIQEQISQGEATPATV